MTLDELTDLLVRLEEDIKYLRGGNHVFRATDYPDGRFKTWRWTADLADDLESIIAVVLAHT